MAPEFRPGDRVRVRNFSTDPWVDGLVCEGPAVRPFVNTQPYGTHRFQETELVLRPVYPEPGQIAVALDAEQAKTYHQLATRMDVLADWHGKVGWGKSEDREARDLLWAASAALSAILDRAREAS